MTQRGPARLLGMKARSVWSSGAVTVSRCHPATARLFPPAVKCRQSIVSKACGFAAPPAQLSVGINSPVLLSGVSFTALTLRAEGRSCAPCPPRQLTLVLDMQSPKPRFCGQFTHIGQLRADKRIKKQRVNLQMLASSTSQQSAARWHLLHKEQGQPCCVQRNAVPRWGGGS